MRARPSSHARSVDSSLHVIQERMLRRRLVGLFLFGVFLAGCGDDDDSSADGKAGAASVGGSPGSGGSGAGAAGSNGGGSAGMSPSNSLGSLGTGSIKCEGVAGSVCPAGNVCCERAPFGDNTCEASFAACSSDGLPVACDEPSDCGAQKCCAKRPGVGTAAHQGTGCKTACDAALDRIVCSTNDDCAGTGACMQSGDAVLKACF